jgi:amino acid transporter
MVDPHKPFNIWKNLSILLKIEIMNPDQFIYTLPQWIIFAGIIASVYGSVENKKIFRITGIVIFIVLGLYSAWAIYNGYFSSHRFLTPEEIISEEFDDNIPGDLPFLARLFPAYIFCLLSGVSAIPALISELKDYKRKSLMTIITAILALLGFFIIIGALKSL